MINKEQKDSFELELENMTKNLKRCQKNLSLQSCLNCDKIFECQIRKDYVNAVYNSMSKGQAGGFDF